MNIIKLSAINSTNDFLKDLLATSHVENFTVVVAEHQTAGRGQMGAQWSVEAGKNLTFSLLIRDLLTTINGVFDLNVAIAVSIAQALTDFNIPGLSVKWPNDILAGNKKLGGVLIENSIKSSGEIYSVIGIGININQDDFRGLPKATSISVMSGRLMDKEKVMDAILDKILKNVAVLQNGDVSILWSAYHEMLFKKGVPMPFQKEDRQFMGMIQGVSKNGNLQVLLEDESVVEYGLKEVQLLY